MKVADHPPKGPQTQSAPEGGRKAMKRMIMTMMIMNMKIRMIILIMTMVIVMCFLILMDL